MDLFCEKFSILDLWILKYVESAKIDFHGIHLSCWKLWTKTKIRGYFSQSGSKSLKPKILLIMR